VLVRTGEELLFAVAGAAVLIYLILVLQFGSWLEPLVILGSVPLALAGAVIALAVTGRGLDVSVAMGALTLVGVAVNNSIVLLDFSQRAQRAERARDGQSGDRADPEEALLDAASVRLRPILLTTATTVAALVPAAVGTTAGSSLFGPFAVTVIGGLIGALAATLLVTPTLAARISRRRGSRPPATPSAGRAASAP
jgi:multidrug efflux pump subunit AcrB